MNLKRFTDSIHGAIICSNENYVKKSLLKGNNR